MKLLGKPNSLTGNTSLSFAPSIGLCLPTELTREQSKILEKQQCHSGTRAFFWWIETAQQSLKKTLL